MKIKNFWGDPDLTVYVKAWYIKKYPHDYLFPPYDKMAIDDIPKHPQLADYQSALHNLSGPAVVTRWDSFYWINGIHYPNKEEWLKAKESYKFNKRLKAILE